MSATAPNDRDDLQRGPGDRRRRRRGRPTSTQACGGDAALRRRVEALLGADERGGRASSRRPAAAPTVDRRPIAAGAEGPARSSAPTSCWSRSARGAWASSTWPSRPQPVRRRVALKVIKPGMDTRQVVARFEAERQALALMDHPNIARVLDAGATDAGRPYFVMELVRGVPITEYCDREQLSIRRAAGAVRAGLPGGAARPPEGDHPPRPQALERPGDAQRRRRRCPRSSTSASPRRPAQALTEQDALHRLRPDRRHAAVHEPRAGGARRAWTSTPAATSTRWACCSTSC